MGKLRFAPYEHIGQPVVCPERFLGRI